jgi:hypothetical protein
LCRSALKILLLHIITRDSGSHERKAIVHVRENEHRGEQADGDGALVSGQTPLSSLSRRRVTDNKARASRSHRTAEDASLFLQDRTYRYTIGGFG